MTDNNVFTERLSPIEFNFYMLRQTVARAKEAKEMGWTLDGIDPSCRATSPGDIYEFLIEEIQQLIKEKENGN
jgi:hypothetical protein